MCKPVLTLDAVALVLDYFLATSFHII